ncbi:tigger transposable element-derived protein 1-like [Onthophagus taurus]|uniref:tigger transposable element-derived protein 1-like n=1 Tax=Onthophagus taurus TaxID=166361 RepID=UPI0039BE068F
MRSSVTAVCSVSANMTPRRRAPILGKMEKALSVWIDDCSNKRMPLATNIIKNKALKIYNFLIESGESATDPDFVASKGHPKNCSHPNVEVIFLPPNTTSLLQPLDQGIISTFKSYYIRTSLQWILNKVEDDSIDVMQAWKRFTILDCINHISSSIKELKPSTLNSCWKNLWPEAVEKDNLMDPDHNEVLDAVEVAKSVGREGFDDMNVEDIQELLVQEEIDMVSLLQMASETNTTDFADEDDENNTEQDVTVIVKDFTVKVTEKALCYGGGFTRIWRNRTNRSDPGPPLVDKINDYLRRLEKLNYIDKPLKLKLAPTHFITP